MKTGLFLNQLLKDTEIIISTVKYKLKELPEEILSQRPEPNKWNILECLDHINVTGRHYLPQMQKGIRYAKKNNLVSKDNYYPGLLGKLAMLAMKPKKDGSIYLKMKTFGSLEPQANLNSSAVFAEFFAQQKEMINIIIESTKIDIDKPRVKSAAGSYIKFKLGDSISFIIAHTERHILQAVNTKTAVAENFSNTQNIG